MSISYGTYKGCEVKRDDLGWYFAAAASRAPYGETVGNLRTIVRVDVDREDPHGILAVKNAIDDYRAVRPW